ncbi:MAG: twin-arginine translocation signal domain-containing protein, partial [Pseudomonadales bacterium]
MSTRRSFLKTAAVATGA